MEKKDRCKYHVCVTNFLTVCTGLLSAIWECNLVTEPPQTQPLVIRPEDKGNSESGSVIKPGTLVVAKRAEGPTSNANDTLN